MHEVPNLMKAPLVVMRTIASMPTVLLFSLRFEYSVCIMGYRCKEMVVCDMKGMSFCQDIKSYRQTTLSKFGLTDTDFKHWCKFPKSGMQEYAKG